MKTDTTHLPRFLKNFDFLKNHIVQWLFSFAILLNILLWGLCALFFHQKEVFVLLRYNVYLGIDPNSTGMWYEPYWIPFAATLFLLFQMIFSWKFFKKRDRVMAHLMVLCGGIIQIFALIGLASVVLINR